VKNLIPHYIQDQFLSDRQTGAFRAYTMFVDLSGFTPLMDVLAREGSRGAEQMSGILNDIFAPLVRLVYTKGGFIPYFAGIITLLFGFGFGFGLWSIVKKDIEK